jgi:hypothetical protein
VIRFQLGHPVITPGALRAFDEAGDDPGIFLLRHVTGNWGEVDAHDRQANDFAVNADLRILSAYLLSNGTRIWIITESDRSSTCILLPEEY